MDAGAEIKRRRVAAGLTQDDVAAALSVSEGAVSQWEKGRIHPRRARAIRLDALLGAEGAVLAALGYSTGFSSQPAMPVNPPAPSVDVAELHQLVADLTAQHRELAERVAAMGAEVAQLSRRGRRGERG